MNTFFSIIIPTFNRAHIITRAIKSVVSQSFQDVEIIVVDDGGTDNTEAVIKELGDGRIIFYKQNNKGVSAARNTGASLAKGEYLLFLDSDDELDSSYLEEVRKHIYSEPDILFTGAKFLTNHELVSEVLPRRPYGKLSNEGLFLAGTFMVRKSIFVETGGYDPQIKYGENTELSIRLYKNIRSKIFIDKPLLIVNQANSRDSNSPENLIESITYTLNKHAAHYNKDFKSKRLYLQILGISYLRLGNPKVGSGYLWKAYRIAPFKLMSLLRLLISLFPILSNRIYVAEKPKLFPK